MHGKLAMITKIKLSEPAIGKDFIGRTNELKQLKELIKLGQSTVFIAPRRFGKTSLVLKTLKNLNKKEYYTVYVDIFKIANKRMLAENIVENVLANNKLNEIFNTFKHNAISLIKNIQLKSVVNDFEFILGFSDARADAWDLLAKSLDFIDSFARKHKKQVVCVFDEFGDIQKLNGNQIVKMFRSQLQSHQNTTYIFSGSYESVMNNIFTSRKSPFYQFARIIKLGYLEIESLRKYYMQELSKEKIELSPEFVLSLLNFTKGHPYYSRLALQQIILDYRLFGVVPSIDKLIDEMLSVEIPYLEKVWEETSSRKEDIEVLLAITEYPQGLYEQLKQEEINIARAAKSLIGKGLVLKQGPGSYVLSDPLFELWIRKEILKLN